jgi:leucyl-tRNA synthetase
LPSHFVDPDVGSGIVTSVPSDAPYDWMALQDLQNDSETCEKYGLAAEHVRQIRPIPIIDIPGWGDLAAPRIAEQLGLTSQSDPRLEQTTQTLYKSV